MGGEENREPLQPCSAAREDRQNLPLMSGPFKSAESGASADRKTPAKGMAPAQVPGGDKFPYFHAFSLCVSDEVDASLERGHFNRQVGGKYYVEEFVTSSSADP